jgi:hypothetical protein
MAFICAAWTNVSLLLIGIVLFGAAFGKATSMPPLVAQREFVEHPSRTEKRRSPRAKRVLVGSRLWVTSACDVARR